MLTRAGWNKHIQTLNTGELTPEAEKALESLVADYDERESVLLKFGDVYPGDDKDEYDYQELPNEWEGKYKELEDRYKRRFTEGSVGESETLDESEDIVDTAQNVTIDDLFTEGE